MGLPAAAPPGSIAKEVSKGVAAAFKGKDLHVLSEPLPYHLPPYRALPLEDFQEFIIHAGIPDVVTTAAEMSTASGVAILVAPGTGTGDWVDISRIIIPDFHIAVIAGLGLWGYGIGAVNNVRWRLLIGGVTLMNDRRLLYAGPDDPLKAQIIIRSGKEAILQARIVTPVAAYRIESRITGWLYPVSQADDSEGGTVPRSPQRIEDP